ncbi:hypothetical protein MNL01_03565 [Bartonella krasnovii]|uniref:Chromosome (Plasmid) partitioning protein ParB n=1 Tax=Bartonella krasnovii TaxID=2267275 RepID=A0A5B9D147_9HYPH|nr:MULTISPECIES: hypothetical protein [Bartonella]QEE12090.1 chromosome (plasmid) partitioning protein ParB [Bartonella krasnovii]UNF39935.1 hypothetical protein MNL09_05485 [Bartonella krasnovii]UNF42902.1 hypothetical protein MNL08_03490 [Bartonella krasnovii]UNF47872.1 hypothetical protein MNL05_04240 [Bartonella krasnovii]UNF54410.1 hypothetical protein MNL01_03565 [Bartonella krasnovii]
MVAAYNLWTPDVRRDIVNPYSEVERLQIMLSCSFKAVSGGFRHLPIRYIIDPPHGLFDAALARQIAIHILHYQFEVPRRRIVAIQERQRTSISLSLQVINRRLMEPVFARAYRRWAGRAMDLFLREMDKAVG